VAEEPRVNSKALPQGGRYDKTNSGQSSDLGTLRKEKRKNRETTEITGSILLNYPERQRLLAQITGQEKTYRGRGERMSLSRRNRGTQAALTG